MINPALSLSSQTALACKNHVLYHGMYFYKGLKFWVSISSNNNPKLSHARVEYWDTDKRNWIKVGSIHRSEMTTPHRLTELLGGKKGEEERELIIAHIKADEERLLKFVEADF